MRWGSWVRVRTVFRMKKRVATRRENEKVLEDRNGRVLSSATAVVHDVKTGRLFLSETVAPSMTICESAKNK